MCQVGCEFEVLDFGEAIVVKVDHSQALAHVVYVNFVDELFLEVKMSEAVKVVVQGFVVSALILPRHGLSNHFNC